MLLVLQHGTAHRKAAPATVAVLRADTRGKYVQKVSIRRSATSSGPPEAIRRATVDLTVGIIIVPGTQEVSKLISLRGNNTIIVGVLRYYTTLLCFSFQHFPHAPHHMPQIGRAHV